MTDAQVQMVVTALGGIQETALQAVVDRLTGSVTGLPMEFRATIERRLNAIDSTLQAVQRTVGGNTTAIAAAQRSLDGLASIPDQMTALEAALAALMYRMDSLAPADEWVADEFADWYDDTHASPGEAPMPTTFNSDVTPARPQRPPDVTPSPVEMTQTPQDGAREWYPGLQQSPDVSPALGGPDLSSVQRPDSTPIAQTVPSTPDLSDAQLNAHMELIEQTEAKRARSESPRPPDTPAAKRGNREELPPDSPLDLWDPTPSSSQEPSVLTLLTLESAMEHPSMELRPGYSALTCVRLIDAWNSLAADHPLDQLGTGATGASLLEAATLAEGRFDAVLSPTLGVIQERYDPGRARGALDLVRRVVSQEAAEAADKENAQPLQAVVTVDAGEPHAQPKC
jgi:hypothetical protein